ncbi:hypothetical protein L6R52_27545 [Myxococcota bacterium]|nr:hypothetical protein [Myxococcota bacterium]
MVPRTTAVAWLLALVAVPGAAHAEPAETAARAEPRVISLDERRSVLMVAVTPSGAASTTSSAELLEAADRVLRAKTGLRVTSPEQAGLDVAQLVACELRVRLSCWARLVTPLSPAYLFVVSVYPRPDGTEQLSGIFIDVEAARRALATIDRGQLGWVEQLEDALFEDARETKPAIVARGRSDDVSSWVSVAIERDARSLVEANGDFAPHGEVELVGLAPGLALELDGRALGASTGGTTILRGVARGVRRLVLSDPSERFATSSLELRVVARETTRVEPVLVPIDRGPERTFTARRVTSWSGAAVGTVGAALSIWAIAAAPGARTVDTCVGASCVERSSRAFASFCELGNDDPASCAGGTRVLALPLGYSLALAGGITALGAWLGGEEDELPWLPIAAGLVAGGLGYGVGAALSP